MSTVDLLLLHIRVVVIVNFHVIQILVCIAQFVDLCPKLFIFIWYITSGKTLESI